MLIVMRCAWTSVRRRPCSRYWTTVVVSPSCTMRMVMCPTSGGAQRGKPSSFVANSAAVEGAAFAADAAADLAGVAVAARAAAGAANEAIITKQAMNGRTANLLKKGATGSRPASGADPGADGRGAWPQNASRAREFAASVTGNPTRSRTSWRQSGEWAPGFGVAAPDPIKRPAAAKRRGPRG